MEKKGFDPDALMGLLNDLLGKLDADSLALLNQYLDSENSDTEAEWEDVPDGSSFQSSLTQMMKSAQKNNLPLSAVIKKVLDLQAGKKT